MNRILLTILLCIPLLSFSQLRIDKELDSINTEADASKFIETNKEARGKIIVFNKEKHNTRLAEDLFKLSTGGKKVYKTDFEKTYYKVIEKQSIPYYRVSYVYLDGKQKTMDEINLTREKVIRRFYEGYRFKDLARLFSMDQNANRGGDLGWFTNGETHPDFEAEVLDASHGVNEIFTIDIPSKRLVLCCCKNAQYQND